MGKTAFVLSLARNVAVDFEKGLPSSLEMSAEQLMMRLIVGESGLDSRDVRNGQLTPEQWEAPRIVDQAVGRCAAVYRRYAGPVDLRVSFEGAPAEGLVISNW